MEKLCTGRLPDGSWCMRIEGHPGLHATEPSTKRQCCARIGHGSWCQRPEGHVGDHASDVAPMYGPIRNPLGKFKLQPNRVDLARGWAQVLNREGFGE